MLGGSSFDAKDLVRNVSANCAVPEIEVMAILDELSSQISAALANGNSITLADIVTLTPEYSASGYAENPWNLSRITAKTTRQLLIASSGKLNFQKVR